MGEELILSGATFAMQKPNTIQDFQITLEAIG
jgi:hypothetical protein